MTRKLASIQKILDISPIEGADKIDVCTVLGWKCVIAKKDNFRVGNLICYVEIDSILPAKPEFEFLKERKYRVRTIKLRKQISQGLVLPLSVLPDKRWKEGDDVTDVLGVVKYDPQLAEELKNEDVRLRNPIVKFFSRYKWFRNTFLKRAKRNWPDWIKKTDEDRIQLFPNICEDESNTVFEVTEKLDGQSATYFLKRQSKGLFRDKFEFGVCSRTLRRGKPDNSSYWIVAREFDIEDLLCSIIGNREYVILQGEIVGKGIQGNKYSISDYGFYAYNLIYPYKQLNHREMAQTLAWSKIYLVPLVNDKYELSNTIDETVQTSIGNSILKEDTPREGIVVRNYQKGISFKIVNPEFLLKHGE